MRSSCHHSSLISYRARRRARWIPLWVGSLFLIVSATALVAGEITGGRDLAAPENAKAATPEVEVYEVNGTTITWSAPLSVTQRVQLSAEIHAGLEETPAKLHAESRKIEIETHEDGLRSAFIPLELMLLRAVAPEVNHTEEER